MELWISLPLVITKPRFWQDIIKENKKGERQGLFVSGGKSHEILPKGLNFVEIYDFKLLDTTCTGAYLVIALPSRSSIIRSKSNMLLG